MNQYRQTLKSHFEGRTPWRALLHVDFLFWGAGLMLHILGGCLIFASAMASVILSSIGAWLVLFGLAAAFIKQDDWGLMITTGVIAVFNLVMFIIRIVKGAFDFGMLLDMVVFGVLFTVALMTSQMMKKAKLQRAQKAALFAQQVPQAAGVLCSACGVILPAGSQFCNACGAKRQEGKKCAACGGEMAEGSMFCNLCGAKVQNG